jgi:hypothetical protein
MVAELRPAEGRYQRSPAVLQVAAQLKDPGLDVG